MEINWSKVIEQALGVLLGGWIAIATLWIKEIFDRRREAQAWFEQTYITEGIDRMIIYASAAIDTLDIMLKDREVHPSIAGDYPREAAERCLLLFPNGPFFKMRAKETVFPPSNDPNWGKGIARIHELAVGLKDDYIALQCELLKCRIKKKAQVHKIKGKREVKIILQKANARIMGLTSQPDSHA